VTKKRGGVAISVLRGKVGRAEVREGKSLVSRSKGRRERRQAVGRGKKKAEIARCEAEREKRETADAREETVGSSQ